MKIMFLLFYVPDESTIRFNLPLYLWLPYSIFMYSWEVLHVLLVLPYYVAF